jgi:hypothetical protein
MPSGPKVARTSGRSSPSTVVTRHEWLGYPDGGVPDVPFDELVDLAGEAGAARDVNAGDVTGERW